MSCLPSFAGLRGDRRCLLAIVYLAHFIDFMLLTAVIPIMPEFLLSLQEKNDEAAELLNLKQSNASLAVDLLDPALHNGTTGSVDAVKVFPDENIIIGLMFASKAFVQILANPFVGPLTNRIGFSLPLFGGTLIMFGSTFAFAVGQSLPLLWIARALQGIASAATNTAGMGMLARAYPDEKERGTAMGIALGGLAMGVLTGPIYGGVLYHWTGDKFIPFIILAGLALVNGVMQLIFLQPRVEKAEEAEPSTFVALLEDPLILITAGALTVGNIGVAILEASLPLWMVQNWGATSLECGLVFLPCDIAYLFGTNLFGYASHKMGRWLSTLIGLCIMGFVFVGIPQARNIFWLILPHAGLGISMGMIDAAVFPLMGQLVDLRHSGVYGSIYAISNSALSLAFAVGPSVAGPLIAATGFNVAMYATALVAVVYAPLLLFLRRPAPTAKVAPGLEAKNDSDASLSEYEEKEDMQKL